MVVRRRPPTSRCWASARSSPSGRRSPEGRRNEQFVAQLRDAGGVTDDNEVIFLCRSGHRSIGAAEAATADGIGKAYNVVDGFEGALDSNDHRARPGGVPRICRGGNREC